MGETQGAQSFDDLIAIVPADPKIQDFETGPRLTSVVQHPLQLLGKGNSLIHREPVGDRVSDDRDAIHLRRFGEGALTISHPGAVDLSRSVPRKRLKFVPQPRVVAEPKVFSVDDMDPGIDPGQTSDSLGDEQAQGQAGQHQRSLRDRAPPP